MPRLAAVLITGNAESPRSLAGKRVPVTFVGLGRGSPAAVSRSVARDLSAPFGWDTSFDSWFDAQEWPAGAALIPGNDAAAWWIARRQDQGLSGALRLATPGLATLRSLVVKYRLAELCREHGIAAPGTWLVEGDEIPEAARVARFPVVLKPQSRVGLQHWTRGRLARNASELTEAIHWYRRTVRIAERVIADDAMVVHPIVQEFVIRPGHEVYHLVGYRSRDGESVVAAHRKVLQVPLRFGNGLCFESAEVDHGLARKLDGLLSAVGFHGIFEAEYVERDGQKLLIDLNPRPYNGLSLETRRGYALPWYLYLDTIGEREALSEELAQARALRPADLVWRDSVRFWTMLAGQTLSGGMPLRETRRWLGWSRAQRGKMIDPFFCAGDRRVGVAHLRAHLRSVVTQPRAFLGTYFRRGLDR